MDQPLNSNKPPSLVTPQERRKHPRKARSIEANYMVKGRWHKGFVQNISDGGAFVSSPRGEQFSPGESIFLVARIKVLREQLRGKIAWVGSHGIGLEYQTTERV
jgi:PilZ domain